MLTKFNSLIEMMEAIPDEQAAINHVRAIRWKNGAFCPHCNSERVYHFSDGRNHKCGDCRKRFSIRVGTIFEDSKLPLRKWLLAIWLVTSHKKGIASTQLAKDIGITQKSAWFVTHRLRAAASTPSFNRQLSGTVEADESHFGGKSKNKHASKRASGTQGGKGKTAVIGVLERKGELRTEITPTLTSRDVQSVIRENVEPGSNLMTDEHRAFLGLAQDYVHRTVKHGKGEYVRDGDIHSNSIESVWALFKRQVMGTHHYLSPKHLSRYLSEMTWRFNLRELGEGERVNALIAQTGGRLTYKELIA